MALLALERLGIPPEEPDQVAAEKEVWPRNSTPDER